MPSARIGVTWAVKVQEHVLDVLYRLAARGGELFLCVEGVGVLPGNRKIMNDCTRQHTCPNNTDVRTAPLFSLTHAMPKRSADDADVETAIQATNIDDDDWMQKLLQVDEDPLILIISQILNKCNIEMKTIKKARIELPSFSLAKWADFAQQAGLPRNPDNLQLEHFSTPVYQLPPSFHKAIFESSWHAQDVYQEVVTREESRVRTLDPVCK